MTEYQTQYIGYRSAIIAEQLQPRTARPMSARSSEEWNAIPTERRDRIVNNPRTRIGQLVSHPEYMSPAWYRISTTPWQHKANLIRGFGRKIKTSSTSLDAPDYIKDPNVEQREHLDSLRASFLPLSKTNPPGTISEPFRDPMAPVYALPGGRELHKTTTDYMNTTGHDRLNYQFLASKDYKEVVVEVPVREEPLPIVRWPDNTTTTRLDTSASVLRRPTSLSDLQRQDFVHEKDMAQPKARRTAHALKQRDRLYDLRPGYTSQENVLNVTAAGFSSTAFYTRDNSILPSGRSSSGRGGGNDGVYGNFTAISSSGAGGGGGGNNNNTRMGVGTGANAVHSIKKQRPKSGSAVRSGGSGRYNNNDNNSNNASDGIYTQTHHHQQQQQHTPSSSRPPRAKSAGAVRPNTNYGNSRFGGGGGGGSERSSDTMYSKEYIAAFGGASSSSATKRNQERTK